MTRSKNPNNELRLRVLELCKSNPLISVNELTEICKRSRPIVLYHFKSLCRDGLIVREDLQRKPKVSKSGNNNRGTNALVVKRSSLKEQLLEKNMEAAVRLGKLNDAQAAGENVVLHDRIGFFRSHRVRGSKVG